MRTFHFSPQSDREQRMVFQENAEPIPTLPEAPQFQEASDTPSITSPDAASNAAATEIQRADNDIKASLGAIPDITDNEYDLEQDGQNLNNATKLPGDTPSAPQSTERPPVTLLAPPEGAKDFAENLQTRFDALQDTYPGVKVHSQKNGTYKIESSNHDNLKRIAEKAELGIHRLEPKYEEGNDYLTITIDGYHPVTGYYGPNGPEQVQLADSETPAPRSTEAESTTPANTQSTGTEAAQTTSDAPTTDAEPAAAPAEEAPADDPATPETSETPEQTQEEQERAEAITAAEEKSKSENPDEAAEGKRELKDLTTAELNRQEAEDAEADQAEAAAVPPESADPNMPEEVQAISEGKETPEDQQKRLMVETQRAKSVDNLIQDMPKNFENSQETKNARTNIETNSTQINRLEGRISGLENKIRISESSQIGKTETEVTKIDKEISEMRKEISQAKEELDIRKNNHDTMVNNLKIRNEQMQNDVRVLGEMKEKTVTLGKRATGRVETLASKISNLGDEALAGKIREIKIEHDGSLGLKVNADETLVKDIQGGTDMIKSPPRLLAGLNALVKKTEKERQRAR